jgi:hypothetical protein
VPPGGAHHGGTEGDALSHIRRSGRSGCPAPRDAVQVGVQQPDGAGRPARSASSRRPRPRVVTNPTPPVRSAPARAGA